MTEDEDERLYVVRCTEKEEPLSEPASLFNAQLLADYFNDNQGDDYCIGDHFVVSWPNLEPA